MLGVDASRLKLLNCLPDIPFCGHVSLPMERSKLAIAKPFDGSIVGTYVFHIINGTNDDAKSTGTVLQSGPYDSTSSGSVTSSDSGTEPTECTSQSTAPYSACDTHAEPSEPPAAGKSIVSSTIIKLPTSHGPHWLSSISLSSRFHSTSTNSNCRPSCSTV